MATIYKVDCSTRKPIFIGVQEENESNFIQFDITPWVEKHGAGVATANAKAPNSTEPYPVIVQRDGNIVTWKPKTADVAIEGVGAFQLIYTVGEVVARTQIWTTNIGPSLIGSGDPPDPIPDYIDEMREIAADALQDAQDAEAWAVGQRNGADVPSTDPTYENNAKYYAGQAAQEVLNAQDEVKNAEAWAVGTKGGVDVPSTDPTYENNSKYWAEQSQANQYSAFIVKSASGDIASFNDGGDDIPVKDLKIGIVPMQSGSGTPSPDNVRAITGWTGANVFVTGTNIWDEDWEIGGIQLNDGANFANTARLRSKNHIPALPNTDYYIGAEASLAYTSWLVICFYDADKNFISGISPYINRVFTTPSNTRFIRFSTSDAWGGSAYTGGISINYPSTATAYHPYTGTTTPISWQTEAGTVYGGELDVTTGVLTIKQVAVDTGTLSWTTRYTGSTNKTIAASVGAANKYNPQSALDFVGACGEYITYVAGASILNTPDTRQVGFYTYRGGNDTPEDSLYMVLPVNATPSGLIVYNKVTPTTVQLTPTEIKTMLGANNVWANTGNTAVTYRADPTMAYAELQALILENI